VINSPRRRCRGCREAGYGRIVSISSEAGRWAPRLRRLLGSQGWRDRFTKVIARENGRYDVTANAIAPGPIEDAPSDGRQGLGEVESG